MFSSKYFFLRRVLYRSSLKTDLLDPQWQICCCFSPVSTFPVINQLEMSHNSSEKFCVTFCEARLAMSDRIIEHKCLGFPKQALQRRSKFFLAPIVKWTRYEATVIAELKLHCGIHVHYMQKLAGNFCSYFVISTPFLPSCIYPFSKFSEITTFVLITEIDATIKTLTLLKVIYESLQHWKSFKAEVVLVTIMTIYFSLRLEVLILRLFAIPRKLQGILQKLLDYSWCALNLPLSTPVAAAAAHMTSTPGGESPWLWCSSSTHPVVGDG